MNHTEIHARLAALGQRLHEAEARLHPKRRTTADHQATNAELLERYNSLIAQVDRDDAATEKQGRHVSDLEHSVRLWLESLDRDGT
jgi:hypothetical protein